MKQCRIWGHRGSPRLAPENTLASFERAVRDGADGIEFDVHVTADGVPVVLHDATLERTSTGRGAVRAQPLAALRPLDAGSWFGAAFRGEKIPTLDEVLDFVSEKKIEAVLEIKDGRPAAIETYVAAVERRGLFPRVYFHSFSTTDLRIVRGLRAQALTQLIGDCGIDLLGLARAVGANAFSPYDEALVAAQIPETLAADARARGIELNAGLVNEPALRKELGRRGVGAVITDVPHLLASGGV